MKESGTPTFQEIFESPDCKFSAVQFSSVQFDSIQILSIEQDTTQSCLATGPRRYMAISAHPPHTHTSTSHFDCGSWLALPVTGGSGYETIKSIQLSSFK